MLALAFSQGFTSPSAPTSALSRSRIAMSAPSSYTDYMARRKGHSAVTPLPDAPALSYAEYMARRNGGAPASTVSIAAPVEIPSPVVVPEPGSYAEYMAKRNGGDVPAAAAAPISEFASYMAKRNVDTASFDPLQMIDDSYAPESLASVEVTAAPVEIPSPVEVPKSGSYAEYMAKRNGGDVPAAAAAPASDFPITDFASYMAKRNVDTASVYDPLSTSDPEETRDTSEFVTYMGKRYRVVA